MEVIRDWNKGKCWRVFLQIPILKRMQNGKGLKWSSMIQAVTYYLWGVGRSALDVTTYWGMACSSRTRDCCLAKLTENMAQRQTEFFSGYDVIMYCFDNYKKGKRLKHQHGEHSSAFLSGTNQMAHELQPYVHDVDNKRVYCTGSSPKLVAEKTMIYQVYYLADTPTYTSGCIFKKDQVWNVKSIINLKNENLEKGMSYENDEDFRLLGTVGQILEDIIPQTQATHNDDDDDDHDFAEDTVDCDKIDDCTSNAIYVNEHCDREQLLNDNANRTAVTDDNGDDCTNNVIGMADEELKESATNKDM